MNLLGLSLMRQSGGTAGGPLPNLIAPDSVAGLARWFKPESLSGYAEEDPVEVWADTTATQNAEQETIMAQPAFFSGTYNHLQFDGVDDFMDFGNLTTLRTVFMVLRFRNAATDSAAILGGIHPAIDYHGGHEATGDQQKVLNASLSLAAVRDGRALLNGAVVTPVSIVKPSSWTVIALRPTANTAATHLGTDRTFSFTPYDLREVALYTSALSDGDMDGVAAWLADKHGIET